MNNQNETLFSGRLVPVRFNDGSTAELKVRQLPLGDYEKAFQVLNDEFGLTALICDQPREFILGTEGQPSVAGAKYPGLDPDCFEAVQNAAQEVNEKGFFAWSQRRQKREEKSQASLMAALATLPPTAIDQIVKLGIGIAKPGSTSSVSPTRRP